jgi:hypothetical protein
VLTGFRYRIHTVSHLAAVWLPRPRLPTSTCRIQPPSTVGTTTIVPQARSGTTPRAETYADASLSLKDHSQPLFMTPSLFALMGGLVIPHDEAYASAKNSTTAQPRPQQRCPHQRHCAPSYDCAVRLRTCRRIRRRKCSAGLEWALIRDVLRSVSIAV